MIRACSHTCMIALRSRRCSPAAPRGRCRSFLDRPTPPSKSSLWARPCRMRRLTPAPARAGSWPTRPVSDGRPRRIAGSLPFWFAPRTPGSSARYIAPAPQRSAAGEHDPALREPSRAGGGGGERVVGNGGNSDHQTWQSLPCLGVSPKDTWQVLPSCSPARNRPKGNCCHAKGNPCEDGHMCMAAVAY